MLAAYASACPAHLLNRTAAANAACYARTDGRTDGEAPTAGCKGFNVRTTHARRLIDLAVPERHRANRARTIAERRADRGRLPRGLRPYSHPKWGEHR